MKVVLDTNVYVSALAYPGGPPSVLYDAIFDRVYEPVLSPALLGELVRTLARKFQWPADDLERLLHDLADAAVVVSPGESVEDITDDPSDNVVLEAALAAHADFIVSGDHHLLRLVEWRGIPIVTPREALVTLEVEPE